MTALGRLYYEMRGGAAGRRGLWLLLTLIGLASVALAGVIVGSPAVAVLCAFVGFVLIVAGTNPKLAPDLFPKLCGLLLLGYAFFGRAFAHLGVPPVFVGEVVLALGLLSLWTNPRRWAAFKSPIAWLYLAFAVWGASRALPYLPVYGPDALRDSVIWGYGAFAILVPAVLARPEWLPSLLTRYARWMPWLILWIPCGLFLGRLFPNLLPVTQEAGDPMSLVKPGDAGVHLAGAATFLLLGLHRAPGVRSLGGLLRKNWFLGAACVAAFIVIGMFSRGGALSTLVAVFAVLVIRPIVAVPKLLLVGSGALVVTFALLVSNVTVELKVRGRDFSAYQLGVNLLSIVGDVPEDQKGLYYTREWRLRWWTKILGYTVSGPHFWGGKGFGVNLAMDDGIRKETTNRSPHSGHMTILARMGVPGAVLWVLLQTSFGISLFAAFLQARRLGQEWWARLDLWILAYWLAFLTDISFAVYLEGPHGGIWFWSLMGLGISVLLAQRHPQALPSRPPLRVAYRHETPARP